MEINRRHGLLKWHQSECQSGVSGRRLTLAQLEPLIKNLGNQFKVALAGNSFESRSIYKVVFGSGPIRVMVWT